MVNLMRIAVHHRGMQHASLCGAMLCVIRNWVPEVESSNPSTGFMSNKGILNHRDGSSKQW